MAKEEITEFGNLSLEQAFDKINDVMTEMSDGDIPLEKSFELYKQGMELLNHCSKKIDKVEKEIEILSAGVTE